MEIVWRVEDSIGRGPYHYEHPGRSALFDWHGGGGSWPGWAEDFDLSKQAMGFYFGHGRAGFRTREAALAWFGDLLPVLESTGFKLVTRKAQAVVDGRSGKQLIFLPFEYEAKAA